MGQHIVGGDEMGGIATVIEFRNAGWAVPETFDLLRELGLGYCCVDEPCLKGLMPQIVIATSPRAAAAAGSRVQLEPSALLRGHSPSAVSCS